MEQTTIPCPKCGKWMKKYKDEEGLEIFVCLLPDCDNEFVRCAEKDVSPSTWWKDGFICIS